VLELSQPPETNLERAGAALGKAVEQLRVVVLDKPRHQRLIGRLREAGAAVITPPDGDVAGALAALLPDRGADLLMGIGGTPEGVMTACAVRALGGFMQGRLAPQRPDESEAVARAGLSTEHVYQLDELAAGDSFFVATGVSGGALLRRPWRQDGHSYTESIVIAAGSVRRVVEGRLLAGAAAAESAPGTHQNGRR
jgi:fructose-1,6-bisphosphatase II